MNSKTKTRLSTSAIAPFGVRMQPELKAKLEAAARESGRSLNSEIVERLERSFTPDQLETKIRNSDVVLVKRDVLDSLSEAVTQHQTRFEQQWVMMLKKLDELESEIAEQKNELHKKP